MAFKWDGSLGEPYEKKMKELYVSMVKSSFEASQRDMQAFDTLINAIEKERGRDASNEQASTDHGTGTTQE